MRVLIVDDDEILATRLAEEFQEQGIETVTASNGQKALDYLDENEVDFMILDIIMPEKTGFEVLMELQNKQKKIRTVVNSNLFDEQQRQRAIELGAEEFIHKSKIDAPTLVERIKQKLAQQV